MAEGKLEVYPRTVDRGQAAVCAEGLGFRVWGLASAPQYRLERTDL